MRGVFGGLGVIIGVGLISLAVFLGWSIGLGWLLTRLLPFSLFEGSLLAMLASTVVGAVFWRVMGVLETPDLDFDEDEFDDEAADIPASRFFKKDASPTWAAWLRYDLANQIYLELERVPRLTGSMAAPQRQELAIRLGELGVSLLKGKSGRAKRLKVTLAELRQHMRKMDLKPYEDDLLSLAVRVINLEVVEPIIENLIRNQLWDQPLTKLDLQRSPPTARRGFRR